MPAYMLVRQDVDDSAVFKAYQQAILPIIQQYHGKFIVRGTRQVVMLEGPVESRRIIILEFPSLSDVEACYHSPELAEVRRMHEQIGNVECIAVEGE